MQQKKLYPYELVGEEVEVVEAKNESCVGIKGKIVDETKSTLVLQQGNKQKTLLKNQITIKLVRNQRTIEGKEIIKRPEDRIAGK